MIFLHLIPNLAVVIVLSCICLVVLHLLRGRMTRATPIRSSQLIFSILTGFIVTVAATNGIMRLVGAQRIDIGTLLISNAVKRTDPARNQIVLVGTSQTTHGIDDVLLEKLINQSGLKFQIIQLALPAMYSIEGDSVLERYMTRTPHLPTAIFIDIGFDSEHVAAIGERRGPFEVTSSNWPRTWQRIKLGWLRYWQNIKAAGTGHPTAALTAVGNFLSDTADSFDFFLCNVTNCAVLRQINPDMPSQYAVGTELIFGHASNFNASSVLAPPALACRTASQNISDDFIEPSLSFRRWQAEKYTSMGVPTVGFYYPPNLTTRTACFQKQFCERIGAYPCLTLDNIPLLTALSFDDWYDPFHVNDRGVPIFTTILARDIERFFASSKAPEGIVR
jgi:hypothetical protein